MWWIWPKTPAALFQYVPSMIYLPCASSFIRMNKGTFLNIEKKGTPAAGLCRISRTYRHLHNLIELTVSMSEQLKQEAVSLMLVNRNSVSLVSFQPKHLCIVSIDMCPSDVCMVHFDQFFLWIWQTWCYILYLFTHLISFFGPFLSGSFYLVLRSSASCSLHFVRPLSG